MKINVVMDALIKQGSISFDNEIEQTLFMKLAEDVVPSQMMQQQQAMMPPMAPQMPMDPAMLQAIAQQGNIPIPQDPSMVPMPQDPSMMQPPVDPMTGMPMPPSAMMGAPMEPTMEPTMNAPMGAPMSEDIMMGSTITNSDIESLVKTINILTSLKNKYDSIKKEQMTMLQDSNALGTQQPGVPPTMV